MKKSALIYIFTLLPVAAWSQTEKQLVPSDLKQATIVTEPITLRKGYFKPGIAFAYSFVDKYFNSSGKKDYSPQSTYGSNYFYLFMFDYGITDRLQVEVSASYNNTVLVSDNRLEWPDLDTAVYNNYHTKGSGIGDSYIGIFYQLIPEKDNKASLSGSLSVTIPTGRKNPKNVISDNQFDLPTGNGYFELEMALRTKLIRYPLSYTGYATYNYKFRGSRLINATDPAETKFRDGNRLEAGGGLNFQLNDWLATANDIIFYYSGKGKLMDAVNTKTDPSWALSYETRLIFQVKKFRLGEGVRIPLKGKNMGADPGYVLLFQYIF